MLTTEQRMYFAQKASELKHSPSLLVDSDILVDKCTSFKRLFPNVGLFYAVKCFTNDQVIATIDPLIDGYDVASVKEIEVLLQNGVSPHRMTYGNPVKAQEAIKRAALLGVTRFAYQSEAELQKIAQNAPGSSVYLRMDVSGAKGSLDFSSKFGADFEDALPLLMRASELKLDTLGVTFHVGSQAEETGAWKRAIEKAASVIRLAKDNGLNLEEINIGGGFPVQYAEGDLAIEELATTVNQELNVLKSEFPDIKILAEPGRFLVADSGVIVSTIIAKETRGGKPWLFLDTGTFQSFIEIFEFGTFFYPVHSLKHVLRGAESPELTTYALTGPTCDSYDTMTRDIQLPIDLEVGGKLMISMTGAYTLGYGSEFNGFALPKIMFIREKGHGVVQTGEAQEAAA